MSDPMADPMTDADRARGLHLHIDCASGAAGDMMLGALIDLGVPVDIIGDALDAIGAGPPPLNTAGFRAGIAGAALTAGRGRRALDIFDRMARAEARLHAMPIDDVAFHEVGANDSVVDVVGTAAALDWLSPRAVTCTA